MNVSTNQGVQISNMQAVEKCESQTKSNNNTSKNPEVKSKTTEDIERICQEALKQCSSGDYINAVKSLASALDIDECNDKAQYTLGSIYEFYTKNALKDAVEWYTAAAGNGNQEANAAIARVLEKLNSASPTKAKGSSVTSDKKKTD